VPVVPASFAASREPARPATLVRADDASITFRVDVPAPEFSPSSLEGFERIRVDGFAAMGSPGEPPVPSRPYLVAIPEGATVSVSPGRFLSRPFDEVSPIATCALRFPALTPAYPAAASLA